MTKQMRILAVDDDSVFLMLLRHVLGAIGYDRLHCTSNASDALELLRDPRQHFDCLLLDVEMPNMNGIELCRRIRALPAYRETPIVMITAMKTVQHVQSAFLAGANDYVHKPINELEMSTRLRNVGELVAERRRRSDAEQRFTTDLGLPVLNVNFEDAFPLNEIGSAVDYLALENYALTLGRLQLYRHSVIGMQVVNAEEIFQMTDGASYVDAMANVAQVIAENLRGNHLLSFAGRGSFVVMLSHRMGPNGAYLQEAIDVAMERYRNLYHALGLPLPVVKVGDVRHAGLFSNTSASQLLLRASQSAALLAR